MPKVVTPSTYTCIRECFYQNKHFLQGDPFPETWLKAGVPLGKHFAKTNEAPQIIESGVAESRPITAGDDKRTNAELIDAAQKLGVKLPLQYTRSQLWKAVIERENAIARTDDGQRPQKGK